MLGDEILALFVGLLERHRAKKPVSCHTRAVCLIVLNAWRTFLERALVYRHARGQYHDASRHTLLTRCRTSI